MPRIKLSSFREDAILPSNCRLPRSLKPTLPEVKVCECPLILRRKTKGAKVCQKGGYFCQYR